MPNSQRIQWIDNAKGIMLLLVVMYHAYSSSPVLQYVADWVMPCFFFISGLLFRMKNESIKDTFVHRTKTLLVPYFLLSVLFVFLNPNNYYGDILSHLKTNAWDILMGYSGFMTISLWFVYVLFEVCITTTVLHKIINTLHPILKYGICIGIGVFCLVMDACCKDMNLPCKLSYFFMAMIMYLLGYLLRDRFNDLSHVHISWIAVIAVIMLVFSVALYVIPEMSNMFLSEAVRLGLMLTSTVSLTGAVYVLTNVCPENFVGRLLRYMANNAMILLAVHMWTICMCHIYIPGCHPYLVAVIALLMSFIFMPLTDRYAPWLVGKRRS